MRPATTAPTIRLVDYKQPEFWIKTVDLHFTLHPTATRVRSKIAFTANDARTDGPHDLPQHVNTVVELALAQAPEEAPRLPVGAAVLGEPGKGFHEGVDE